MRTSFFCRLLLGLFLLSVPAQTARSEPGELTLAGGAILKYQDYKVENDSLRIQIENGSMLIAKESLSEKDQARFFGNPSAAQTGDKAAPPDTSTNAVSTAPPSNLAPTDSTSTPPPSMEEPLANSAPTLPKATAAPAPLSETQAFAWFGGESFFNYPKFENIPDPDSPPTVDNPLIKAGEFTIPIPNSDNASVKVVYRVPVDDQGNATPGAQNMVFYAPFPTEKTDLNKPYQVYIGDALGCSLYSFSFIQKDDELTDPKLSYLSKESGWFQAVFVAQAELCDMFRLKPNKLILLGESAGSGMAEGLAVCYPDRVESVAITGGEIYLPLSDALPKKWLIMNTRGDATRDANITLASELRDRGVSVIYCTPAPDHKRRALGGEFYNHVPSTQTRDLMIAFIAGVLRDREATSSGQSDRAWPYSAHATAQDKFKEVSMEISNPAGTLSSDGVLLPSATFAYLWAQIPPPIQKVTLPIPDSPLSVLIGFPGRPVPKGIVVYYNTISFFNYGSSYEDISGLAEDGYAVISPGFGTSVTPEQYISGVQWWVASQPALNNVPVHLCARGSDALRFLACAADSSMEPVSFCLMDFEDADISPDVRQQVVDFAQKCKYFTITSRKITPPSQANKLATQLVSPMAKQLGCQNLVIGEKESDQALLGRSLQEFTDLMDKASNQPPKPISPFDELVKQSEDAPTPPTP